jgi:hypothetical protein
MRRYIIAHPTWVEIKVPMDFLNLPTGEDDQPIQIVDFGNEGSM